MVAPAAVWGFEVSRDTDDEAAGVVVEKVLAKSPAAVGGLKAGDRLLTLDGRWTDSVSDTFIAATAVKPGKPVVLVVTRGGKEVKLTVTPGKGCEFAGRTGSAPGVGTQGFRPVLNTAAPPGRIQKPGLRPGGAAVFSTGRKPCVTPAPCYFLNKSRKRSSYRLNSPRRSSSRFSSNARLRSSAARANSSSIRSTAGGATGSSPSSY